MDTTTRFTLFMCLLSNLATVNMNMNDSSTTNASSSDDDMTTALTQNGSDATTMRAENTSTTMRHTSSAMPPTSTAIDRCYDHTCNNQTCDSQTITNINGRCYRGNGYCYIRQDIDSANPSVVNYTLGCVASCVPATTTVANVTRSLGCCQEHLCNGDKSLLESNGGHRATFQWLLTLLCVIIYLL